MTQTKRRILLGIGAALLVGGWGTTRYADEQQQAFPSGRNRMLAWKGRPREAPAGQPLTDEDFSSKWQKAQAERADPKPTDWAIPATRTIYASGVALMAIGAGVLAFAVPKTEARA